MTKVISYQRVSSEKQDLERQAMLAAEYCKQHDYELVGTIAEKVSGAKSDRESINRLMALTSDDCDLVVVSELSRVTREDEYDKIIIYIRTLKDNGIDIVFLDEPSTVYKHDEPFTLTQLIILIVKAQGASEERMKIKERMHSGKRSKARNNPYMSINSHASFGFETYPNPNYVFAATPKTLIRVNEKDAATVRMCFNMAHNGQSCQQIADYLTSSTSKKWGASSVQFMLRNKIYKGERELYGVIHHIEAIIDPKEFDLVQECISKRRAPIAKEHFNPLKGLLFCGDCGLGMMIVNSWGKEFYKCLHNFYKHRKADIKDCHNSMIKVDTVIDTVYNTSKERLSNDEYYGKTKIALADLESELERMKANHSDLMAQQLKLQTERETIAKNLEKITDDYVIQVLNERAEKTSQEMGKVVIAIAANLAAVDKLQKRVEDLNTEIESVENITDIHQMAEFFNKVISKVIWNGKAYSRKGTLTIIYKNGDTIDVAIE